MKENWKDFKKYDEEKKKEQTKRIRHPRGFFVQLAERIKTRNRKQCKSHL